MQFPGVGALIYLSEKGQRLSILAIHFWRLTNSCNGSDVNETSLIVNQLSLLPIQRRQVRVVDKVVQFASATIP